MVERDRRAPDRARAVRGAARRRGRRHAGARPTSSRPRCVAAMQRGARGAARDVRHRAAPSTRSGSRPPPRGDAATAVPAERLRELNERAAARARRLHRRTRSSCGSSSGASRRSTRAGSTGARPRRSRSRSLLVRRDPDPAHRPGHRARHVLAPPRRPPRRRTPARRTCRCSTSTAPPPRSRSRNSPLSEYACLGFEYGYSVAAPEALVLWEAQFGDFVNGAQIVIDQFIVSGLSKWRQSSRLTLLLPHGYEGNGPEHSSARLERFLQLAAQENIRIANRRPSAQYFHLLRRQALDATARPLVVMTPKGLLRLKEASSTLDDLADGRVPAAARRPRRRSRAGARGSCSARGRSTTTSSAASATRDADGDRDRAARAALPVPGRGRRGADGAATRTSREVVWVQEEPQNMGPWRAIRHRLEEAKPDGVPLRFVGRPWRASPSEGYPTAHQREQDRIVREALAPVTPLSDVFPSWNRPSAADQVPRSRDVSDRKMRHDEGLTMGSFRLKLVGYFLLLALIPLAGFFFGFRQVAERSETRLVDARTAGRAARLERGAPGGNRARRAGRDGAGRATSRSCRRSSGAGSRRRSRASCATQPDLRVLGPDGFRVGATPVVRGRARGSGDRPGGPRRLGDRLGQARLGSRGAPAGALRARAGGRDRDPRPRPGRGRGPERPGGRASALPAGLSRSVEVGGDALPRRGRQRGRRSGPASRSPC